MVAVRFLFAAFGLLSAGALYQVFGSGLDRRRNPAPGQLVPVGRRRIHIHREGAGEPTVVLEAGLAASSLSWSYVQAEVAQFTTTVSYDRAGLGWSDKSTGPRRAFEMVAELRLLLARAGCSGPFILVGHSFGGLLVRAFAATHPENVAGLVLVDPVSLEYWAGCSAGERRRLAVGTKLSRRGALLARFGVVRLALALFAMGGRRLPKLIGRTAAGPGNALMERLIGEVRKLPATTLPIVRSHWSRAQSFATMAATLEALPSNAGAVRGLKIPPHVPVVVLSASSATDKELQERDEWAAQSEFGQHLRLQDCGHWLPLERPMEVAAAIRGVIEQARHC